MAKEYEKKVDIINTIGVQVLPDFYDAFDAALSGWTASGTGADFSVATAAAAAYRGASGLRIKTRTTTPAINDVATAQRTFAKRECKFAVVKIMFKPNAGDIAIRIYDGSTPAANPYYQLKYDSSAGAFLIETANGVWATKLTLTSSLAAGWNMIGLKIDVLNKKYHSIIHGSTITDISNVPSWNAGDPYEGETFTVRIQTIADQAASQYNDIDDFLFLME